MIDQEKIKVVAGRVAQACVDKGITDIDMPKIEEQLNVAHKERIFDAEILYRASNFCDREFLNGIVGILEKLQKIEWQKASMNLFSGLRRYAQ